MTYQSYMDTEKSYNDSYRWAVDLLDRVCNAATVFDGVQKTGDKTLMVNGKTVKLSIATIPSFPSSAYSMIAVRVSETLPKKIMGFTIPFAKATTRDLPLLPMNPVPDLSKPGTENHSQTLFMFRDGLIGCIGEALGVGYRPLHDACDRFDYRNMDGSEIAREKALARQAEDVEAQLAENRQRIVLMSLIVR